MKLATLKQFFGNFFGLDNGKSDIKNVAEKNLEISNSSKNSENKLDDSNSKLPFWCATAKVKKENIYGEEHIKRSGTKHFRGGAKVYIADAYWGMCDSVTVIGHHRSNSRYVKIDIHVKRLENFRLELAYSPKVLELIKRNFEEKYGESNSYTKEYAEKLVEALPIWIENYHKEK